MFLDAPEKEALPSVSYDCLGRTPPFQCVHAFAALGAPLGIQPDGIEHQPVEFRFPVHHHECFV
jgi:hypothetical protein